MYPPSGSGPGFHPPQPPPGPPQPYPPGPYQQQPPPPPTGPVRPPRSAWRVLVGLVVAGFGLLAVLGGGALIAHAYSNSRQVIHNSAYSKELWRNVPVEKLLPPRLGREHPDKGYSSPNDERGWTRAAISSDTSCRTALSGELARVATERGCVAAVRATYVDDTGGTAATVALVAFRESQPRVDLEGIVREAQRKPDHAVRALAAPGTQWKDSARTGNGGRTVGDVPMFVAVTTGPADGRRPGRLPEPWGRREYPQREDREAWAYTAQGLAESLATRLYAEARKVGA
ncbi:hypothetical protein ACIHFD_44415 [Nonomuraea sp. NPDC051941]|uniref:hypothetical protein n=1 Tax=Nonomuraea sp. NPDC051941 TaxID=3364373 RepID=UPI0037CAA55F